MMRSIPGLSRLAAAVACGVLCLLAAGPARCQPGETMPAGRLLLAMKKLNTLGSVLYIAAHPDDENTGLLGYLANEKRLRTGYLSITRGDGGQNLIGKEQGALLGLIRTQELLAARRVDGAEQFFTRAVDFGYSKGPEETFTFWDHDQVLADVVWVIRTFRPDVIITRFPPTAQAGHGHHTASAILAAEAFSMAGDPLKFSEQLNYTETWQPRSLWWNTYNFGSNRTQSDDQYHLDVGLYNPLLGRYYGDMAAESRSMHKSQGFGRSPERGEKLEYFKPTAGDTACGRLFCGLDFSWNRVRGGDAFHRLVQRAIQNFDPENPAAVLPLLLSASAALGKVQDDFWKERKRIELEEVIAACAALWCDATAADYAFVAGDSVHLDLTAVSGAGADITLERVTAGTLADTVLHRPLARNEPVKVSLGLRTPSAWPVSTPYWLQEKHGPGSYKVRKQELIGKPENDPVLSVHFYFTIAGKPVDFDVPVQYRWNDPVKGALHRPLEVRPPVTMVFGDDTYLFTGRNKKSVTLLVTAQRDSMQGTVRLETRGPFTVHPAGGIEVSLPQRGDEKKITFEAGPDSVLPTGRYTLSASFVPAGGTDKTGYGLEEIHYDHIEYQTVFPRAEVSLVGVDVRTTAKSIGYIPGAGDAVPACLEQIGCRVTLLDDEWLEKEPLTGFDAIVTGVRAYNTNKRMPYYYAKLMAYVRQGGTLVVQYNTNNFLGSFSGNIGPYPFTLSRDRVTDETAAVTFTDPAHPLLNTPNRITAADFDGWIQERGLYFPQDPNPAYETVISMSDPGEAPLANAVLSCAYGKGHFVYTSLSFFRELPAGVPGAYRLFANMISLGRK